MNKVVARNPLSYQIDFPSPVYTAAIVGDREDIAVGVGGGKRFGMPNIIVALEKSNDPKLCWNVCSWLDLDADIPWSGGKVPLTFPEEPGKSFLVISHLDSVSVIEYEKNENYSAAKAAEEEAKKKSEPEEKLGKRDSPPPPKNAPVFLRRTARLALETVEGNPDKKVVAVLRSAEVPKRLSDQLMFVCQDDSSVVMFRLQKRKGADGKPSSDYEACTYIIPSNELRMGTAHPTDMDARETPNGIVLMILCDDKKVRFALLPQAWHCLKACLPVSEAEHATDATKPPKAVPLKPLAVMVRSLLVLTPQDLNIPFNVMRSTLRVGLLMDSTDASESTKGGAAKKGQPSPPDVPVIALIMAYDSKNSSTNSVMATISIVDGSLLVLTGDPTVRPVCKGAVTNLMPLYDQVTSVNSNVRTMPDKWLVTTVEGTIVEITKEDVSSGDKDAKEKGQYPVYATARQRPFKPKRCPPALAAVHQEPISAAAISLSSGLLVTVDIAQKAKLSRLDIGTGKIKKVKPIEDGIPQLFPVSKGSSILGLFGMFTAFLVAIIAFVAGIAPSELSDFASHLIALAQSVTK